MRILFLEDRPSRQRIFLPNKVKDVEVLKSLRDVYMPGSNECKGIISHINSADYIIGSDVKLVIIHGSALDTRGLQYLNAVCKERIIKLICFSGGVSQQIFNSEGFEYLNLNSSDFYNQRLIPFLEKFAMDENVTLLEVANVNWQLSYLFLARQLNHSIQQEEDDDRRIIFQNKLEQVQQVLKFKDILNVDKIDAEINMHAVRI